MYFCLLFILHELLLFLAYKKERKKERRKKERRKKERKKEERKKERKKKEKEERKKERHPKYKSFVWNHWEKRYTLLYNFFKSKWHMEARQKYPTVSTSDYEITSIKVWFLPLISLSFQSLTWPYSVNIKDIAVTFWQNVLYHMKGDLLYKSANHKKITSWVFTESVTYVQIENSYFKCYIFFNWINLIIVYVH